MDTFDAETILEVKQRLQNHGVLQAPNTTIDCFPIDKFSEHALKYCTWAFMESNTTIANFANTVDTDETAIVCHLVFEFST